MCPDGGVWFDIVYGKVIVSPISGEVPRLVMKLSHIVDEKQTGIITEG